MRAAYLADIAETWVEPGSCEREGGEDGFQAVGVLSSLVNKRKHVTRGLLDRAMSAAYGSHASTARAFAVPRPPDHQ